MELLTISALLFLVGCLVLLFVALSLPVLERSVRLLDQTRELVKTALFDLVQFLRSLDQSRIDTERAKNQLEIDMERADIETKKRAGKLQLAQDYGALRLVQFRRTIKDNEVLK